MSSVSVTCVLLLCTGLIIVCQGTASSDPSFAGHHFIVSQTGSNVTLSTAAVIPSGNTTYRPTIFSDTQLSAQTCGDRFSLCDVTLIPDQSSSRMAALLATEQGAAAALFERMDSDLMFMEQYIIPLPNNPPCTLTAFYVDVSDIWHGLCYAVNGRVVDRVNLYTVNIDFSSLSSSTLTMDISAVSVYSFGLSRAFYSFCSGFFYVHWFDSALLSLRVDAISQPEVNEEFGSGVHDCSLNGARQVVLYQDNTLWAYCQNVTAQVDICNNFGTVEVVNTKYFCLGNESIFLEVQFGNLQVNTLADYAVPFPLNTSVPYVGNCVYINGKLFFVATSNDGIVVLTDVLQSSTTILTTDAPIDHQVVENRFVSYSTSNSSTLLDLSCPDPTSPILVTSMPYVLNALLANNEFSCPTTVEPPTNSTTTVSPQPTSSTTTNNSTTTVPPQPTNSTTTTTEPLISNTASQPITVPSTTVLTTPPTTLLATPPTTLLATPPTTLLATSPTTLLATPPTTPPTTPASTSAATSQPPSTEHSTTSPTRTITMTTVSTGEPSTARGLTDGVIIGIVFGVVFVLLVALFIVFVIAVCYKLKKRSKYNVQQNATHNLCRHVDGTPLLNISTSVKSAPGHNSVKQTSIANIQLHPGPSPPAGNPSASNVTQKTSDVSPSTPTNPTLNVAASVTKGDTSTFDTTLDVSSTTIRNPAPNDQPASANNGDTTTSNGSNVNPTTFRNPAMFASANNGDTSIPSPQGSTVSIDSIREKNSTKSYNKSDFVGPMLDPAEVLPANKEASNVDTGSPTFKRPIPQKGPPPKELPVSFPPVPSRQFISVNQPGESPNNELAEQAESLFKSVPPQQDDPNTTAIVTSKFSGLPSKNQPTDSPPQTERGLTLSGRQSDSLPVESNSRRVPNQPAARPGTSSSEEQALNDGVNQAPPLSLLPLPEQKCVSPVQATQGHHNNGPETQSSTVSGIRNPVPGGGFHFTEHEALRAGRDQSRYANIAQKLEGASESAANIPHDFQIQGPKATAATSEEPNNDTLACVSEPQQAVRIGNNQSPSNTTQEASEQAGSSPSQLGDSQDVTGTNDSSSVDTSTSQNTTLSPSSRSPLNSATGSTDNVASGSAAQDITESAQPTPNDCDSNHGGTELEANSISRYINHKSGKNSE